MHDLTTTLDAVRKIVDDVVEPNAPRLDIEARWPEQALRALQRAGVGGLVVPEKHGGLGGKLFALARVCEELGRSDASTALCFGMHSVATACIAARASQAHAEQYLAPIAAGDHLTTLALSEPGTGSHFYLPATKMQLAADGSSYTITGTKSFVTSGGNADSYVVSTVDGDPDAAPGHFSMVLVPADRPGLGWGEAWQGWGMRGNSSRSVDLDGVSIPVANRLGDEGEQIWYVFNVVAPYFLVAMAGTYLGVCQRAVDEAIAHLSQRRYSHTGSSLAEIDILQHRVGTVWSELCRTRQLCHYAANAADEGLDDALPALCAAKAEVAHAAVHIVNECMTLVGGIAYRDGSVLQRLLRDARAAHVMSPTTDLLYTWTGRALLGLPLLGA